MIIDSKGELDLPLRKEILELIGQKYMRHIERMWKALWHTYIRNKGTTATPYWAEQTMNAVVINKVLKKLSEEGWIFVSTRPSMNWSEMKINEDKLLEHFTEKQLENARAHSKFKKYMLKNDKPKVSNLTKINGKKRDTGLIRDGFYKTGTVEFQFDTIKLQEYYDVIKLESIKSMSKIRDKYPEMRNDSASYDEVITSCLEYIMTNEGTYSSGQFYSDSRGRNIAGYLDKIFNPVAFKMARALLVIPESYRNIATNNGLKNKYLFIAELCGFKEGTVQEKIDFGRECYYSGKLENLDWDNEHDRSEIHENIWLERTYDEISEYLNLTYRARVEKARYENNESNKLSLSAMKELLESNPRTDYKWSVPIEIDMSASVLGYLGLLMNHKPFMERCNMLGDNLVDAWDIKGINNRKQAKVIMRAIYGSSQSCISMWKEDKIEYTAEDVRAYEDALNHGEIALGDRFSKFVISNCNPKPEMTLHVRNEKFEVECNRFRNVGEETKLYDLYDTNSGSIKRIHHTTTKKIPDLKQFRRFMVTGLIHNLDGGVMNTVVYKIMDLFKWVLDVHDADILCCEAADPAREFYAEELEDIHFNRNEILENYFASIGINQTAALAWLKVKESVEEFEGEFKCNPMVLK